MDYAAFVAQLALWGRITGSATNTSFQAALPLIIEQAEQQIYRDLNLLATIVTDTGLTIPNQRAFTLPQNAGYFVVLESVNLLNGTDRTPLIKISRDAMDMLFPNSVTGLTPRRYAPLTDQVILLGPSPGGASTVECIGTIRPETLSALNANTFLSDQLPDLFFSAAMYALTGYQQNWGGQADNPQMANSWKEDYKIRLASATGEEVARKFQSFRTGG